MEEDEGDQEYNEETLRKAQEENSRVVARKEDITEAEDQLRRHVFLGKNAKVLLATQAGEMDMAPSFLRVLEHPPGAAISTKGLNEQTLPLNITPTNEILCRAILQGTFTLGMSFRKQEPSPVFLNFLVEVITLYDAIPETRGDPLLAPYSFEEHALVRSEDYDELHQQLRLSEIHSVVQEAKKIIQTCIERYPSVRLSQRCLQFVSTRMPWAICRESVLSASVSVPSTSIEMLVSSRLMLWSNPPRVLFGVLELGATLGCRVRSELESFLLRPFPLRQGCARTNEVS
jgi:hypothetical protein